MKIETSKVKTMQIKSHNPIAVFNAIEKLEKEGWKTAGRRYVEPAGIINQVMVKTEDEIPFEPIGQCTHEFEIQSKRKLCYLCLHEEPLDAKNN